MTQTQTKRQRDQERRIAIARAMEWSEWLALNNPGLLDDEAFQSFTDYFLELHWKQLERLVDLICEEVGFVDLKCKGGKFILAEIIHMTIALGGQLEVMVDDPDQDIEMQVRFVNEDSGEPDSSSG